MRRIRFRKEYRLQGRLFILITLLLCLIIIPKPHRAAMISFFSKECRDYQQVYSRKLNDRIPDYTFYASLTGIEKCEDANDIGNRILLGQLRRVKSGRNYKVGNNTYEGGKINIGKAFKSAGKEIKSERICGDLSKVQRSW